MNESWLRTGPKGHDLRVRVTPNASRDAIDGIETAADGTQHIKIRVRAVPEGGKANRAAVALLAHVLKRPKSALEVVTGANSRLKTVRLQAAAADRDEIAGLLGYRVT